MSLWSEAEMIPQKQDKKPKSDVYMTWREVAQYAQAGLSVIVLAHHQSGDELLHHKLTRSLRIDEHGRIFLEGRVLLSPGRAGDYAVSLTAQNKAGRISYPTLFDLIKPTPHKTAPSLNLQSMILKSPTFRETDLEIGLLIVFPFLPSDSSGMECEALEIIWRKSSMIVESSWECSISIRDAMKLECMNQRYGRQSEIRKKIGCMKVYSVDKTLCDLNGARILRKKLTKKIKTS